MEISKALLQQTGEPTYVISATDIRDTTVSKGMLAEMA